MISKFFTNFQHSKANKTMTSFVKRFRKDMVFKWNQYKYRFVPWIALNLKNTSMRSVPNTTQDQLLSDVSIESQLQDFFSALHNQLDPGTTGQKASSGSNGTKASSVSNKENLGSGNGNIKTSVQTYPQNVNPNLTPVLLHKSNLDKMLQTLGFQIERTTSNIEGGGTGVKVTKGVVPQGTVVALYPGVIYKPFEPILLQSLGNQFVFRCIDGVLLDGSDKGISKFLFRSCGHRDRVGPYFTCDLTWLTPYPENPMAVGQYVNNHNKEYPANVAYQEFDVPILFPFHLRQYLPNVFYTSAHQAMGNERLCRTVVLISTRDIEAGEELLSSYFTAVHR